MQAWGPFVLQAVASNGELTQLYPSTVSAGAGTTTAGTEVRRPSEGAISRAEVYTSAGTGGEIEIWDVAGLDRGSPNNVDTGTILTNAFLLSEIAENRARLIWKQGFAGAVGARYPVFNQRTVFMRGLAARYISTESSAAITLTTVCAGGFSKFQMTGV
jgi:hypothetical protein